MGRPLVAILEKLGAEASAEDTFVVSGESLGVESIFKGADVGACTLSLFSDQAFAFTAPPEMAALGVLWMANVDKPADLTGAVRDAHRRLRERIDAHQLVLSQAGFTVELAPPEPEARARATVAGHQIRLAINANGAVEVHEVGGRKVPKKSQIVVEDAAQAEPDDLQEAIRKLVQKMHKAGLLTGRGVFDAPTVRGPAEGSPDDDSDIETSQGAPAAGAPPPSASPSAEGRRGPPRPRRRSRRSGEGPAVASTEGAAAASSESAERDSEEAGPVDESLLPPPSAPVPSADERAVSLVDGAVASAADVEVEVPAEGPEEAAAEGADAPEGAAATAHEPSGQQDEEQADEGPEDEEQNDEGRGAEERGAEERGAEQRADEARAEVARGEGAEEGQTAAAAEEEGEADEEEHEAPREVADEADGDDDGVDDGGGGDDDDEDDDDPTALLARPEPAGDEEKSLDWDTDDVVTRQVTPKDLASLKARAAADEAPAPKGAGEAPAPAADDVPDDEGGAESGEDTSMRPSFAQVEATARGGPPSMTKPPASAAKPDASVTAQPRHEDESYEGSFELSKEDVSSSASSSSEAPSAPAGGAASEASEASDAGSAESSSSADASGDDDDDEGYDDDFEVSEATSLREGFHSEVSFEDSQFGSDLSEEAEMIAALEDFSSEEEASEEEPPPSRASPRPAPRPAKQSGKRPGKPPAMHAATHPATHPAKDAGKVGPMGSVAPSEEEPEEVSDAQFESVPSSEASMEAPPRGAAGPMTQGGEAAPRPETAVEGAGGPPSTGDDPDPWSTGFEAEAGPGEGASAAPYRDPSGDKKNGSEAPSELPSELDRDDGMTGEVDQFTPSAVDTFNALADIVGDGLRTGKTGAFMLDAEAFAFINDGAADQEIEELEQEAAILESRLAEVRSRLVMLKAGRLQAEASQQGEAADSPRRNLAQRMKQVRAGRSGEEEPVDVEATGPAQAAPAPSVSSPSAFREPTGGMLVDDDETGVPFDEDEPRTAQIQAGPNPLAALGARTLSAPSASASEPSGDAFASVPSDDLDVDVDIEPPADEDDADAFSDGVSVSALAAELGDAATQMVAARIEAPAPEEDDDVFGSSASGAFADSRSAHAEAAEQGDDEDDEDVNPDGATRVALSPLLSSTPSRDEPREAGAVALVVQDSRALDRLQKYLSQHYPVLVAIKDVADVAEHPDLPTMSAVVFVRPRRDARTLSTLEALEKRRGGPATLLLSSDAGFDESGGVDLRLDLAKRAAEVAQQVVDGLTQLGVPTR